MLETPAGPVSRLRWYADRGFELDLNATVEEVSLMLVAVPLPVDGTAELREGPVELARLEILFKAQVDVQGGPGQLTDATVRLVQVDGKGEHLHLVATVEDAESGETQDVKVLAPVIVPAEAPAAGGPRPRPADEAELDWEDDETFETMFKDPLTQEDPLPMMNHGEGNVSSKVQAPTKAQPSARKGNPMDRLMRALMQIDEGDDDSSEELTPEPAAATGRGSLHVLRDVPIPSDPEPQEVAPELPDDPGDAQGLLGFLIEREELELEEGHSVEELVGGAAPIVGAPKGPEARAKALSEWLFDQPAVAELYIDDDALASLLDRW